MKLKGYVLILILALMLSLNLLADFALLPTAVLMGSISVLSTTSASAGYGKFAYNSQLDRRQRLAGFIESNSVLVARDISRGEGDSLDAISVIIAVESDRRSPFYHSLQNNYDSIFSSQNDTADKIAFRIFQIGESYSCF